MAWRSGPHITAGIPCQPVSVAGKRRAAADERWLWPHVWRVVREVGPRYLFLECTPDLLRLGGDEVVGSLAEARWDAEWCVLSAASVGAPHKRSRIFILGHAPDPDCDGRRNEPDGVSRRKDPAEPRHDGETEHAAISGSSGFVASEQHLHAWEPYAARGRAADPAPEYRRIVEEARPAWFLRENVPGAPDIDPAGYSVHSFLLDNAWLDSGDGFGEEQMRRRRFWFGVREGGAPDLRRWMSFATLELPMAGRTMAAYGGTDPSSGSAYSKSRTVAHEGGGAWYDNRNRRRPVTGTTGYTHDGASVAASTAEAGRAKRRAIMEPRQVPVALGDSGKVKRSIVQQSPPTNTQEAKGRTSSVTGAHTRAERPNGGHGERYTLADMLRLQGLPETFLDHCPFTVAGKRKAIGNGVAQATGRAIARAIREALVHVAAEVPA